MEIGNFSKVVLQQIDGKDYDKADNNKRQLIYGTGTDLNSEIINSVKLIMSG